MGLPFSDIVSKNLQISGNAKQNILLIIGFGPKILRRQNILPLWHTDFRGAQENVIKCETKTNIIFLLRK